MFLPLSIILILVLLVPLHAQQRDEGYRLPPPNQGLQLDRGKWIELQDNPTIVLDTFTVECWFKASNRNVIVSRDRPGNAIPDWSVVYDAARERIEFMTGMNSQPDSYFWTPVGSFPHGVWSHLAIAVNGPAGTAKVYINGNQSSVFYFASRNFTVRSGLAWGGYYENALGATGDGQLDECRYWRTERTQQQINSLMARRIIDLTTVPELVGFWRFCGNYKDETMYGNHMQPRSSPPIVYIPDLPMGIDCAVGELQIFAPPVQAICPGETVNLLAQAVGGREPYSYVWSPMQFLDNPYVRDPVARPPHSMYFVVTVFDADGMSATDSVFAEVFPPLVVDAGPDMVFCGVRPFDLSAIVVSGQPPIRFTWEAHPTMDQAERTKQRPRVEPTQPGTYTYVVQAEDMAGCFDIDSVTVTIREFIEVDLGPNIWSCGVKDITLRPRVIGGTPPFTFEWTPDSLLDLADPSAPTTRASGVNWYHVRVTDVSGCVAEDSVEIRVYPDVTLSVDGASRCSPGMVTLTCTVHSGKEPFRVAWSPAFLCSTPNELTTQVRIDSTTTFTVRVVDANGCAREETIVVPLHGGIELELPELLAFCRGDSVSLAARVLRGTPPYHVQWEPASFVTNPNALQTGVQGDTGRTFVLTVRDAFGCEITDSVQVMISDGPVVDAGSDIILCRGDSAILHPDVAGGVPPYRYEWQPRMGLLSSPSEHDALVRPDRSTLFLLRVTDSVGCSKEDDVRVTVLEKASVEILPTGLIDLCEGDSLQLNATPGYSTYQWYRNGLRLQDSTAALLVRTAGTYHVQVITTSGCQGFSPPTVIRMLPVPHPLIMAEGSIPFCQGDSVTLRTDRTYATYQWLDGSGIVLSRTNSLVVKSSMRVRVVVTDTGACPGISEPVSVDVVSYPSLELTGRMRVCRGDVEIYSVVLVPGDSCSWEVIGGTVLSADPPGTLTVRWSEAGTGSIRVRGVRSPDESSLRCSNEKEYIVGISELPEPSLTVLGDSVFCEGEMVLLTTQPGAVSYEWMTPTGERQGSDTLWAKASGSYAVRVTSVDGCVGTSPPVTLRELPRLSVGIEGPNVICEDDSIILLASSGYVAYRWSNGMNTRGITVRSDGEYSVEVTDSNGCVAVSLPHTVRFNPGPVTPMITRNGNSLRCTEALRYQWYLNGIAIPDSDVPTISITQPGNYHVVTYDEYGCPAGSGIVVVDNIFEASTLVGLPTIDAEPGDIIEIPLVILDQTNLSAVAPQHFSAVVTFDESVLVPVGWTPHGTISEGKRKIAVSEYPFNGSSELTKLFFMVTLGTTSEAPLVLEHFDWGENPVAVRTQNGLLRIAVCREGGERLFDGNQRLGLEQNIPNPAYGVTRIRYSIITSGHVRLVLTDSFGRHVATLVDAVKDAGEHEAEIKLDGMSSGMYRYELRTSTGVRQRLMVVTR